MNDTYAIDFPDPEESDEDGLLGFGGDLRTANLVKAYSSGIFPWTSNPVSWWSPDPRGIFEIGGLYINRSLRRFLKRDLYQVTFNQCFEQVIEWCGQDRAEGTWIDKGIRNAYIRFHHEGYAQSVECWQDGELVGGLYGVALRGLFAGESMFSRADNASKVAVVKLMERLVDRGYRLMDIQMLTPVTESLGGQSILRSEYLLRLRSAMKVQCHFRD